MEDLRSAVRDHVELVSDLVEKLSSELRSGFRPAYDNFVGFFHAIDWKEPWLICLISFHAMLFLITIVSRKNVNFQLCLSIMAFSGVFLAERINRFLAENWKSFAGQNYFDPHGLFISVLWSGPLLISILIVVNTLFTLVKLIIRWKRAELRHRARLARGKQD
uniref:Transmembrane protein 18 n=1 Tax=Anthurium amnicola TaxID=1678845 RepID=A0A1D1XH68_9ARAE